LAYEHNLLMMGGMAYSFLRLRNSSSASPSRPALELVLRQLQDGLTGLRRGFRDCSSDDGERYEETLLCMSLILVLE